LAENNFGFSDQGCVPKFSRGTPNSIFQIFKTRQTQNAKNLPKMTPNAMTFSPVPDISIMNLYRSLSLSA